MGDFPILAVPFRGDVEVLGAFMGSYRDLQGSGFPKTRGPNNKDYIVFWGLY